MIISIVTSEFLIRQLFNVKRLTYVLEYVSQFTKLVDQLATYPSNTDQLYFVMDFIDGLHSDIKLIVLIQ